MIKSDVFEFDFQLKNVSLEPVFKINNSLLP